MTERQSSTYFRLWRGIINKTPALIAIPWKERDPARHALNKAATGHASTKRWNNRHVTAFFEKAKEILDGETTYEEALANPVHPRLHDDDTAERRKQCVWSIKEDCDFMGWPPAYAVRIAAIHLPKFEDIWEYLARAVDYETLRQMRFTIRNRVRDHTGLADTQIEKEKARRLAAYGSVAPVQGGTGIPACERGAGFPTRECDSRDTADFHDAPELAEEPVDELIPF